MSMKTFQLCICWALTLCFTPFTLLVENFHASIDVQAKNNGQTTKKTRNENYNHYLFKAHRNIFDCGKQVFILKRREFYIVPVYNLYVPKIKFVGCNKT